MKKNSVGKVSRYIDASMNRATPNHVYRQVKQLCRVDVTDTARGIFDLLRARNNKLYLHGYPQNDVEIMLNYLCTC